MADTEVRLALVMNGGVSLAVWIAGVTHEIDLIRRATLDGAAAHLKSRDKPVADRWRELLLPADGEHRRVVVDVLAGTSAGGLNATMLATAIAHQGTMDPEYDMTELGDTGDSDGPWLREVWCSLGALRKGKLLPEPDDQGKTPHSMLDGGFFHRQAEHIMAKLGEGATSDRHPVTLFTTASGMGRQSYTATDAADQPFDVADHRFVYRFSTDQPWGYDPTTLDFTPPADPGADFADPERLALAARASASFPVAFEPVRELGTMNVAPPKQRPVPGPQPSWLMDGGVLDNAPFGPVLDTIAKGALSGKVDRYVVYVVPSIGIGTAGTTIESGDAAPPSWRKTIGSAIQYPREVDFRSDVEELAGLHVDADTAWSDTQRLYERAVSDDTELQHLVDAAGLLLPTYTRGRAAGAVWEAITVRRSRQLTALDRDASAPMNNADDILETPRRFTPGVDFPVEALRRDDPDRPLWPWGLGPAERVARTILRSTRTQLDRTLEQASPDVPADALERRLDRLSEARACIFSLRGMVGAEIEEEQVAEAPGAAGVTAVADAIDRVFDRLRVQEALGKVIDDLQKDLGGDGAQLVRAALAVEIVSRCTSSRTPDQRSVPFKFVRLGPDVELPLLDGEDRRLASDLGNRILYGTQVAHFGAFGADAWRRWDWLMGRLHAVAHLGMLLHDTSTPAGHERAQAWVAATQREVIEAEGMSDAELRATLGRLENDFPAASIKDGAARLIEAMNDADRNLSDEEMATRQLGERLVAVSGGLGTQPGRWVRALIGLEEPADITTAERAARWFATPARATFWSTLTDGRASTTDPTGPPVHLLSVLPWTGTLAVGLGMVLAGSVAAGAAPAAGIPLACVGTAVALVGAAGLAAVLSLRRGRGIADQRVGKLLGTWLPDRSVTRG